MQNELELLTGVLASRNNQPDESLRALHRLADAVIGTKLFTLMDLDTKTLEASRIYTNMPSAYPVLGKKPLPEGDWTTKVIKEKRIFVANDMASIAKVFPDHEQIRSLGCGSIINIPVVAGGRVLGTVNCLEGEGAYGEAKAIMARQLILPSLACFLFYKSMTTIGGN